MKPKLFILLIILPVLVLGSLLYANQKASATPPVYSRPGEVLQQSTTGICFEVADNNDSRGEDGFTWLDWATGVEHDLGLTGTYNIEAIALEVKPGRQLTGVLYGADAGQMGTFNLTTGTFIPLPNALGTGNGVDGPVLFNDADGLSFDPITGIFYGSLRRRGTPNDLLFQIDPVTGLLVKDAFGLGVDYVPIAGVGSVSNLHDVDDIAVDIDGTMYGLLNNGSAPGAYLVNIDKTTGAATAIGLLNVDDMEGLGFDPSGQLLGTTGKGGGVYSNMMFHVDKTTGSADVPNGEHLPTYFDYEGMDCMTSPTAVELLYFRVDQASGREITLGWATAAEIDNIGYNLYRSSDTSLGHAEKVAFVSAPQDGLGHTYRYVDTVPAKGEWWYWLSDVDTHGRETLHGPVSSQISGNTGTGYQIFVPIVLKK